MTKKLQDLTDDQRRDFLGGMLDAAVDYATLNKYDVVLEDEELSGLMLLLDTPEDIEYAGFIPDVDAAPKLSSFVRQVRREAACHGSATGSIGPKLFKDKTEPELRAFINLLCGAVGDALPPDVIGFMLLLHQDNGITQYGGSITRDSAVGSLRELANRLESGETVERAT